MFRTGIYIGFIFILLLCPFLLFSQESSNPVFISVGYRMGENKPHRAVIKNLTYPYAGVDLKLGWQTIGEKEWQRAYKYPSYGVGLNYCSFDTEILGNPVAAYFFVNFPQFHTHWCQLDLELNFGLSYGINPYDEISNPNNFSTGTSTNAIFGIFLNQTFHLSSQTDLSVSGGLGHYSNGALGYPNLGLNIPMVKVGMTYHQEEFRKIKSSEKLKFKHTFSLNTYIGGGTKKLFAPTPNYHEILVSPSICLQTGFKRHIGVGFEMAYNEAKDPAINYFTPELLTYAVHLSHEYTIARFTILTQLGIYLKNQPADKFYFERVGFGYYLTRRARAVLNVKAHYFKAEYVEAGLVYEIHFN